MNVEQRVEARRKLLDVIHEREKHPEDSSLEEAQNKAEREFKIAYANR
ncbi:MAG: hypothetical protein WC764_03070 [Candidatus Paceibacterota bacterium]